MDREKARSFRDTVLSHADVLLAAIERAWHPV